MRPLPAAPSPPRIVAAPYEATASFVPGCGRGPEALAEQLAAIADDDRAFAGRPPGDWTWVEAHPRTTVDPEAMVRAVARHVAEALADGCLPLVVGGEHTVTPGALAAFDDPAALTVVQFDAHADLRETYEGTPWNHACALRRALDHGHPLVQIGIRSGIDAELRAVYGPDADGAAGLLQRRGPPPAALLTRSGLRERGLGPLRGALGPRLWVTIDLDVLDPGCAPGVGTPEPDGLSFHELVDALEELLDGRTLAGADVVELCPTRDDGRTARLAARLLEILAAHG